MPSREIKSLDQLMDGQIVRRFNAELQKVWENIFDLRTDAYKPRQIALIFKFAPNALRAAASMKAVVQVKLVPPSPLEQTVLMHVSDDGDIEVSERTNQMPGQVDIEGNVTVPNVVTFNRLEAPTK